VVCETCAVVPLADKHLPAPYPTPTPLACEQMEAWDCAAKIDGPARTAKGTSANPVIGEKEPHI
jgi:hypothetical protein